MASTSHRNLKSYKSQDLGLLGVEGPNTIQKDKRFFYRRPEITETQASTNFEDSNDSFT